MPGRALEHVRAGDDGGRRIQAQWCAQAPPCIALLSHDGCKRSPGARDDCTQVGFPDSSGHGVQVPFMSRVTSLTSMPEAQLNRWIKRIGLLLIVGIVAFVAFYAVDRFRASPAPIVDQQLVALEEAVRADPADTTSRGKLADTVLRQGPVRGGDRAVHRADRREQGGRAREPRPRPGIPEDGPVRPGDPRLREGRRDRDHGRDGQRGPDARRRPTTGSARSRWRRIAPKRRHRPPQEVARDPAHGRGRPVRARDRLPGNRPGRTGDRATEPDGRPGPRRLAGALHGARAAYTKTGDAGRAAWASGHGRVRRRATSPRPRRGSWPSPTVPLPSRRASDWGS